MLGEAPGLPKSTQNRPLDPLGTPRGTQERPQGVAGASRERLGAPPARPRSARRVPKGGSGRQRRPAGAPRSAPKQPKSTPSRVRKRKRQVFSTRRVREVPSERFFAVLCRFSVFSQCLRTLLSTAPASKIKGSAVCAASRVARATQPQNTSKIERKIDARKCRKCELKGTRNHPRWP